MNRRGENRVEMELPCRLSFPEVWPGAVDGFTANLHSKGVLVKCDVQPGRGMPALGDTAQVQIDLPAHTDFPPKLMQFDTTLVRIDQVSESKYQFAMKIQKVDFADRSADANQFLSLDPAAIDYLM